MSDEKSLLEIASDLAKAIVLYRDINNRANTISLNAAIEGARMRARAPAFSIVAQQVQTQAHLNLELSEKLETLVRKIGDVSLVATAARYYELAEDLIDKVWSIPEIEYQVFWRKQLGLKALNNCRPALVAWCQS